MTNAYNPFEKEDSFSNTSDEYIVYKEIPINLGKKSDNTKLVLMRSVDGYTAKAEIQTYHRSLGDWVIDFMTISRDVPYFSVHHGFWGAVRQQVLILYSIYGNDGLLNYCILGRNREGKIAKFIERTAIFQGNIWFEDNEIIESEGSRFNLWINRRGQLMTIPVDIPILKGSHVIRHSILKDGKVDVDKTYYCVNEGENIQLLRKDLNPITERIIFYVNPPQAPIMEFIHTRCAIKFLSKGIQELSIVPGEYDWEKAVHLSILVK